MKWFYDWSRHEGDGLRVMEDMMQGCEELFAALTALSSIADFLLCVESMQKLCFAETEGRHVTGRPTDHAG